MQTESFRRLRRTSAGFFILALLLTLTIASANGQSSEKAGETLDTLRVDSDLVDLKVSVISLNRQPTAAILQQKDFVVLEDGATQEISFFAAAEVPFDLVLLLDLSGSTAKKINLIKRSAKRFVEASRPLDRIAVVTFTDQVRVQSDLTRDRAQLKQAIDYIEKPVGGTNFWDALRFVLERVLTAKTASRRSAVVVMTDGVDNALPDVFGDGSETRFDQLLTLVSESSGLIFPVYIDTEKEDVKLHRTPRPAYAIARAQLEQLAQTSGTTTYKAAELKDLDRVYEQVINDLGTVYSIGYKPSNQSKDGQWRSVTVKLPAWQHLTVRTKSGYYAKAEGVVVNQ